MASKIFGGKAAELEKAQKMAAQLQAANADLQKELAEAQAEAKRNKVGLEKALRQKNELKAQLAEAQAQLAAAEAADEELLQKASRLEHMMETRSLRQLIKWLDRHENDFVALLAVILVLAKDTILWGILKPANWLIWRRLPERFRQIFSLYLQDLRVAAKMLLVALPLAVSASAAFFASRGEPIFGAFAGATAWLLASLLLVTHWSFFWWSAKWTNPIRWVRQTPLELIAWQVAAQAIVGVFGALAACFPWVGNRFFGSVGLWVGTGIAIFLFVLIVFWWMAGYIRQVKDTFFADLEASEDEKES